MATAPRANVSPVPAIAAANEPAVVCDLFERDGFARINEVLSAETCSELLAHVNAALERKKSELAALDADDLRAESSFGDVLMREKTTILIAHRLSTVRKCDQIYLLERGEVKACGTYEELTASNQYFAAMAGGVS